MAKANSIRLDESLMKAAFSNGALLNRSTAQQIEFWAGLGQKVSEALSPNDILAIQAGVKRFRVEQLPDVSPDSDEVFRLLSAKRSSGDLRKGIQAKGLRYQASTKFPGMLEQVHPNGRKLVGKFANGEFVIVPQ